MFKFFFELLKCFSVLFFSSFFPFKKKNCSVWMDDRTDDGMDDGTDSGETSFHPDVL